MERQTVKVFGQEPGNVMHPAGIGTSTRRIPFRGKRDDLACRAGCIASCEHDLMKGTFE
jgi:hypothetical protein